MKNTTYIFLLIAGLSACTNSENATDAYGMLEATELFISAELPGRVNEMTPREGSQIAKGDLLAVQDTQSLFLNKQQVIATMNALTSQLQDVPVQLDVLRQREKILSREIKRIEPLVKEGAATTKQLDDLTGELDVVTKQLKATESQLSTANRAILAQIEPMEWQIQSIEEKINNALITSPQKGTILKRYKEVGEYVSPGMPLFKIADLSDMTARVYVTGSQLASITIGQKVNVLTDGYEGDLSTQEGTITWIADQAEFTPKSIQTREERVNLVYALKISIPNPDGLLKIGMPVEVRF